MEKQKTKREELDMFAQMTKRASKLRSMNRNMHKFLTAKGIKCEMVIINQSDIDAGKKLKEPIEYPEIHEIVSDNFKVIITEDLSVHVLLPDNSGKFNIVFDATGAPVAIYSRTIVLRISPMRSVSSISTLTLRLLIERNLARGMASVKANVHRLHSC